MASTCIPQMKANEIKKAMSRSVLIQGCLLKKILAKTVIEKTALFSLSVKRWHHFNPSDGIDLVNGIAFLSEVKKVNERSS